MYTLIIIVYVSTYLAQSKIFNLLPLQRFANEDIKTAIKLNSFFMGTNCKRDRQSSLSWKWSLYVHTSIYRLYWPCLAPEVELKCLAPCPVRRRLQFMLTRTRSRTLDQKGKCKTFKNDHFAAMINIRCGQRSLFSRLNKNLLRIGRVTSPRSTYLPNYVYDFTQLFGGLKYEMFLECDAPDIGIQIEFIRYAWASSVRFISHLKPN